MAKRGRKKKGIATKIKIYGRDCFREWGKRGGNPVLLRLKEEEVKENEAKGIRVS